MPRGPRFLPPGWSVEVSTRTICGFYLLPANPQFARVMVGVLGRAQEKHPVQIHAVVATSNHYHMILTPTDGDQLSDFMEFVNGNLARETGRLIDWHGSFWADRFHLIPISPEPEALIERLRYVLSNTVKENLVASVFDWEGLHCAEALIDGKPLQGIWYDREVEYEVRRQAQRKAARSGTAVQPIKRGDFMIPYDLLGCPLRLLETVALGTHEGPPPARFGDQQTPSHLYSDQSQELLALVEDLGNPDRDDEQVASAPRAD